MWIGNIAAQEKPVQYQSIQNFAAGVANPPDRREGIAKWANTSAQISRIDFTNGGTGDFASGSQIVVLGHD